MNFTVLRSSCPVAKTPTRDHLFFCVLVSNKYATPRIFHHSTLCSLRYAFKIFHRCIFHLDFIMIKCKKEQPPAPKKATGSANRNIRYRAKNKDKVQSIIDLYNHIHPDHPVVGIAQLLPKVSMKGRKCPKYNPPDHQRKSMTNEQISEWRRNETKKRKALKMRESRARKAAVLKSLIHKIEEHIKKMAGTNKAVKPALMTKATSTQANASDHKLPVNSASIDFVEIDAFLQDALVEIEDAAAEIPISEESLDDSLIRDVNLEEVLESNVEDALAEIEGTREDSGSEGAPVELGTNLNKVFDAESF
jgi:hypothetical protein